MKNNWTQWTAGVLSSFALVSFLAGCESKKSETTSQAPSDQSQSMARESEKQQGAPLTPGMEKGQTPEAGQPQKPEKPAGAG